MNKRQFAKTIGGALAALALDFGIPMSLRPRYWFDRVIREVSSWTDGGTKVPHWCCTITQIPVGMKLPTISNIDFGWRAVGDPTPAEKKEMDDYGKCSQFSFSSDEGWTKDDVLKLADRIILERKYELGEPDGVEDAISGHS